MELLKEIDDIQTKLVDLWHQETPLVKKKGFFGLVAEEHLQNFLLWHEEDIARSPKISDREVTSVKNSINRLRQHRSDLIEKLDEAILAWLSKSGIQMPDEAPMNSETPGSMIDRCSIISLKIYHMRMQVDRPEVDTEHVQSAKRKLEILIDQRKDLFQCLFELIDAIQQGTRRFKIYNQFKMYNDPSLNPKIYNAKVSKP